jgi:hypothetical protein
VLRKLQKFDESIARARFLTLDKDLKQNTLFTDRFLMGFVFLFIQLLISAEASSPTPTPSLDESQFLHFNAKSGDDAQTYRMLDDQNRLIDSGSHGMLNLQDSITSGHARAKQMVDLLMDQELQNSFSKLNARGREMLKENPEMKNPVTIVAGAVALWVGKTVRLLKDDTFKIETRLAARDRAGEFAMESPLLNGKLSFTAGDGVSMSMNRTIASINSRAEMNYRLRDQVFTGQLVHPLTNHLDLSFGAGQVQQSNQTDGRAALMYNLNF